MVELRARTLAAFLQEELIPAAIREDTDIPVTVMAAVTPTVIPDTGIPVMAMAADTFDSATNLNKIRACSLE